MIMKKILISALIMFGISFAGHATVNPSTQSDAATQTPTTAGADQVAFGGATISCHWVYISGLGWRCL